MEDCFLVDPLYWEKHLLENLQDGLNYARTKPACSVLITGPLEWGLKEACVVFSREHLKKKESSLDSDLDFIRIVDPSKNSLGAQEIEEVLMKLYFKPSGGKGVIWIHQVEKCTLQAASRLLKALEEPKKGWVFLLSTSYKERLLKTLVSRMLEVKLRPFPVDDITLENLEGLSKETIDRLKENDGAWIIKTPDPGWNQVVEDFFLQCRKNQPVLLNHFSSLSSEGLSWILPQILRKIRTVLCEPEKLQGLMGGASREKIEIFERILELKEALSSPVSFKSLATRFVTEGLKRV